MPASQHGHHCQDLSASSEDALSLARQAGGHQRPEKGRLEPPLQEPMARPPPRWGTTQISEGGALVPCPRVSRAMASSRGENHGADSRVPLVVTGCRALTHRSWAGLGSQARQPMAPDLDGSSFPTH